MALRNVSQWTLKIRLWAEIVFAVLLYGTQHGSKLANDGLWIISQLTNNINPPYNVLLHKRFNKRSMVQYIWCAHSFVVVRTLPQKNPSNNNITSSNWMQAKLNAVSLYFVAKFLILHYCELNFFVQWEFPWPVLYTQSSITCRLLVLTLLEGVGTSLQTTFFIK